MSDEAAFGLEYFVRGLMRLALVAVIGAVACNPANTPTIGNREMCHLGLQTPGARLVSWRELADDPIAFDGRTVRIVGRLHLQFENYSLAPSWSAAWSGPIWVDLGEAIDAHVATRACRGLVALEATLDLERNGHLGMSAGTLVVRRVDALESNEPEFATALPPATTIDSHVVTVEEYDACVRARRCKSIDANVVTTESCNSRRSDRRAFPMNCVRWLDAARYCAWVGKRLPTEQEWFSAVGVNPPSDAAELPPAERVLVRNAEVATNALSEWTRSSTCPKMCTKEDCIEFDRVIVRDPAVGEPFRLSGSTHGLATRSADLGFRCAR